jgi:single-strand DNA-binding protein
MPRATVTLDGNVGRDPELTFSKTGKPFARFSVAVTDRVKVGDNDWQDGDTTWYEITVFGKQAEDLIEEDRLRKGSKVVLQGRLKLDKWEGRDGEERSTLAVVADWVGLKPWVRKESQGGGKRQPGDPWATSGGDDDSPPF